MLDKWKKAIPRKNYTLTHKSCVCELHFEKEDMISTKKIDYGTHVEDIPIKKRLKDDVVPSIWPGNMTTSQDHIIYIHVFLQVVPT